ncbi:X-ray repair cross-complementing protein 5-like [Uloborus diversus]|uniref:X-ray repair cross-complementing protein 5-like n=1 Tax=Uloborus diversus TaxID=327109 RepID=UPI002409FEB7|nr:X-ray repair cross-complementing protein 5-like [Uloborus diversus]
MAGTKEAIAVVFDIGSSMRNLETPSVFENAKNCISMIIQRKIFSESKDEIALILFGTDEAKSNSAADGKNQYKNIEMCQTLAPASWELLEFVNKIEATDVPTDFIMEKALLVAIDLLQNQTIGKKFVSQRILLFSCFSSAFSDDSLSDLCEEIKNNKIDINIIGPVSYADEETNSLDSSEAYCAKTSIQIKTEDNIKKLLKEVNGESYSFE